MCGIAAVIARAGEKIDLQALLENMVAIQFHRGPDSQNTYIDDERCVGLAHARLAILDPSPAANQPMSDRDGIVSVVFNGEIYNWRQLRQSLEREGGHRFRTDSDTEVLLEAYHRYGHELPKYLHGMFAFAIYDTRDRTLFCARDRLGKKPLLFAETNEGVAVASELPAVRLMPGTDTRINHNGLASMLLHNFRHIPDPETVYAGVQRLRGGHAMVLGEGGVKQMWRYWHPKTIETQDAVEDVRLAFERAVEMRMDADVPVGALLSGGVDSTGIVAHMTRHSSNPVRTYALGWDRDDEDVHRARKVATQFGCEHHESYYDSERQLRVYGDALRVYGEPIALLPLIHSYELCEAVRNDGIKVLLSGHGADELFYGYTGHIRTALLSKILRYTAFLAPLARAGGGGNVARTVGLIAAQSGKRKAALYESYGKRTWPGIINNSALPGLINIAAQECEYWGSIWENIDYIDESNFVALMVENAHSLSISTDLPAMMASVEMRAPFMDQKLVELAFSIPFKKKVASMRDTRRLKYVLKQALQGTVPQEVLFASKRGFGHGIQEKAVLQGPWKPVADELFAQPHDADGLFNPAAIQKLWKSAQSESSKGVPWSMIMKLLVIQLWLQRFRN